MLIIPSCIDCKYFLMDRRYICMAFPEGIPEDILLNKRNHDRIFQNQNGHYIYTPKDDESCLMERKSEKQIF